MRLNTAIVTVHPQFAHTRAHPFFPQVMEQAGFKDEADALRFLAEWKGMHLSARASVWLASMHSYLRGRKLLEDGGVLPAPELDEHGRLLGQLRPAF